MTNPLKNKIKHSIKKERKVIISISTHSDNRTEIVGIILIIIVVVFNLVIIDSYTIICLTFDLQGKMQTLEPCDIHKKFSVSLPFSNSKKRKKILEKGGERKMGRGGQGGWKNRKKREG